MKYSNITFGQMEAIINKLGGTEGAQRFLRGDAEVTIKTHTIDCDANPYVPNGWSVRKKDQLKSIVSGQLIWNPDEVELYLCYKQETSSNKGNELREKLEGRLVLNACVLDYLLVNSKLIPEEWKGKTVCFWGTIYHSSDNSLYVRYLYWDNNKWQGFFLCLDSGFCSNIPAVLSCK